MTDFPREEFEARAAAAQAAMAAAGLDALWLSSEAEVRYFTGFRTLFWQSPTRAWRLILPREGAPIAIIPEIGAALMAQTWVEDIRTWPAPRGGDEGVSLTVDALQGYSTIGIMAGQETALREPLSDFQAIQSGARIDVVDAWPLVRALRMTKSEAEISVIREICAAASRAFSRAPNIFAEGMPQDAAFRAFKIALLEEGAEDVPYLVGGAGQGGYADVISPPGGALLQKGDVFMLDTGASLKGYFCDFDRNWAIGEASDEAKTAHATLWAATEAGLTAARPGATAADVCAAMASMTGGGSDVGRMGHGLGMQLTEQPSLAAFDNTVLRPNMVLTLEPSMMIGGGKMMVHEENILITDGAPELLTERAPADLPVI
ncbi:MAG: Xaa-Pro peptidase family protein [Pseudomonadota bacterium]